MKLTGAEIVWECLAKEGVDLVFGYPGGAILPVYDALSKYPQIHHVLTRHEQGASHMADGYARATGRVGVAIATSGPGSTNLVTGIATAMMDSSPVVFITGQVPTSSIGTDAFQEADITGVTLPVTKHNYLVSDVEELAFSMREAFHIARSGRPGPVLIDIPKDVQNAVAEFHYPDEEIFLPGYQTERVAEEEDILSARELIRNSQRPVILAGHGILVSDAANELLQLAERAEIPVALTLLGKGGFPEQHPLCLGMMGMHGTGHANHAIQEADLLLALGMRFDDRVTGAITSYAPDAKKLHVDIDPAEINKVVPVDLGIVGDLKPVLGRILNDFGTAQHPEWLDCIRGWRAESSERDQINNGGAPVLAAAEVIHDLWEATDGEALIVTDVGQHQMWEAQYYLHSRPNTLITSGGMGTMGFGFPAAIGAKMGRPEEDVWVVCGDGGFQMTLAELATAQQEGINVKIALINNGYLGMVRQWQEFFYEKRYNATPMLSPDFCKLAASYGVPSIRVENRAEVRSAVSEAGLHTQGPVLVEFVVERYDTVFPMVAPGAELHNMIRRPKLGP